MLLILTLLKFLFLLLLLQQIYLFFRRLPFWELINFRNNWAISTTVSAFLLLFIGILAYQSYWQFFCKDSTYLEQKYRYDRRRWFDEQMTVKGNIYDRTKIKEAALATSEIDRQSYKVRRDYPQGEICAHLTGYSDIERERSGLEEAYFDIIKGKRRGGLNVTTNKNYLLNKFWRIQPRGSDLVTTIDTELQKAAWQALAEYDRAALVAIEPKTGEILAMVSKPSFDPTIVNNDSAWAELVRDKSAPLFNRAIQGQYPPGSTIKVIFAAAAVEQNMEKQIFNCPAEGYKPLRAGKKRVYDHEYYTWKKWTGHGKIGLEEALVKSSNVYFAQLGDSLGPVITSKYARKFKIGQPITWNEANSDFKKLFTIRDGFFAEANVLDKERLHLVFSAIGQSDVLATPIQTALIAATIANDGLMPQPKLSLSRWNNTLGRVIEKETARKVRQMMIQVVEKGTAIGSRIKGLSIAGKTGTAENPHGKSHSWFICFGDAKQRHPKIALAVIVENAGYGSTVAVPVARQVLLKAQELGYFE